MPIPARVTDIAAALHLRFRHRVEPVPEPAPVETPAADPPALSANDDAPVVDVAAMANPALEESIGIFRERVVAKWTNPEHAAFLASDLNHVRRYALSLCWIPEGEGLILDPASGAGHFSEVLRARRGYRLETPGYFNLEKDRAPYPDATFDGVILMEVLEHFTSDPMFALAELNRVLKPGGFLFLTTPNIASWCALHNLIGYESPYLYGVFIRQGDTDRHNREYTVREVGKLVTAAGFRVERLEGVAAYPAHDVLPPIPGIDPRDRGDTTFCLARKEGLVADRYPSWLYATW
jgi:SAM-dependent methyltransferase